ncbi:hypothetical protein GCM10027597_30400 [Saccharopolyspora tripterygii]
MRGPADTRGGDAPAGPFGFDAGRGHSTSKRACDASPGWLSNSREFESHPGEQARGEGAQGEVLFYEVGPDAMQWMFELAKTRSSRGRWGEYRAGCDIRVTRSLNPITR